MDNKVPKGEGLGQSTRSQIRPEFTVARNEGMELDQPRNSGDLEKFVQFSEQEPVPFGIRPVGLFLVTFKSLKTARSRVGRFIAPIEELLILESNWRHSLEKTAMILQESQSGSVENSTEKPRWATDQPKSPTVEDQAGRRNDRREISSWARLRR